MGDVYQVRTGFTGIAGAPYLNTIYYEALSGASQAGADEAVNRVDNFWSALSTSIADNAVAVGEPTVDVLSETTGQLLLSFTTSRGITQPAVTAEMLPQANQGLVRLETGSIRDGNRVRGRIFIPGPSEVSSADGQPSPTYLGNLNAAGPALLSAAVNVQLAVWHRPVRDAAGSLIRAGEALQVVAVTARPIWAILRSRRD